MLLLLGSLGLLLGPRAPLRAPRAAIVAALDYKDPVVAEEFQACQALDTEAVEDELAASGIPVPPTMNDMEMRMMLIEVRMRKAGTFASCASSATAYCAYPPSSLVGPAVVCAFAPMSPHTRSPTARREQPVVVLRTTPATSEPYAFG